MIHVGTRLIILLGGNEALHPARIEVHKIAGTTPHISQMLNRQSKTARAGGPHHHPVMITREMLVTQRLGKGAVIDLVILPANALFRHAGGAARFKDAEGLAVISLWPPDFIG